MKLFVAIFFCNSLICSIEYASKKSLVYGESNSGKVKTIDETIKEIDSLLGGVDVNFELKSSAPNLDNPQEFQDVIKHAVDISKLKEGRVGNDKLMKFKNTPFSGWAKGSVNGKNCLLQFRFGEADGQSMFWYKNGQKSAWIEMENNQPNGISLGWHKNGVMYLKGEMQNGFPEGLSIMWYDNGQKESEKFYKNGKLHGLSIKWYENGQKKAEGNFDYGKLMTSIKWKPNGEICPVTNVKDGSGGIVVYNDDGTEKERFTFKDGVKIEAKEQSRNKPDAKISSDELIKLLEDSIGESTPALSLPPRIK